MQFVSRRNLPPVIYGGTEGGSLTKNDLDASHPHLPGNDLPAAGMGAIR